MRWGLFGLTPNICYNFLHLYGSSHERVLSLTLYFTVTLKLILYSGKLLCYAVKCRASISRESVLFKIYQLIFCILIKKVRGCGRCFSI